jgi:hypothetical protein
MSMYVTGLVLGSETTMETPRLIQAGGGATTNTREGDMSGIGVDENGNFWAANEVANSDGTWGTAIAHFTMNSPIYYVTNTNDSGAGSLRDAINQVNAGNFNEIDFAIGATGSTQTITPASSLPALTANGIYINGLSQGGAGNTTPLVTVDGTSVGIFGEGLILQGSKCDVSGLLVEYFGFIGVSISGNNNTVGGSATGAGNVISGNGRDGVFIGFAASGVQLLGNSIGTNLGRTSALANGDGVEDDGANDTIGGYLVSETNVISGNTLDGVFLNGATGDLVAGNRIGTNAAGNAALPNSTGVELASTNNRVFNNTISGNTGDGVLIDLGVSGIWVAGDRIGTDSTGASAVPNNVGVAVNGPNNTIGGGTTSSSGNLVSGNTSQGVGLYAGASGVLVLGNEIGTNLSGTGAIGNGTGIEVDQANNTIGATSAFDRNFISGNAVYGMNITASGVQVEGNYIGLNKAGTGAVGNGGGIFSGIELEANNDTVGGSVAGAGNVISGNGYGIGIGSGVSGSLVQGNFIGTNAAGTAAVSNTHYGIWSNGNHDTIGGPAAGQPNVISGNGIDGILLNSTAANELVQANRIGTDPTGASAIPNGNGVELGSNNNFLFGNVISGNIGNGVLIDSGVSGSHIEANYIGTNFPGNAAIPNSTGIAVSGSNNTIGGTTSSQGNLISGNNALGVGIFSGASGVEVLGNTIGANLAVTAAISNGTGIEVEQSNNTIGGTALGDLNYISGNIGYGILITTSGVAVQGNFIGTNRAGTAAVGNSAAGVEIIASNDTVGGTVAGARNFISGNDWGIGIESGESGNLVQGNYIGTNIAGTGAVGNTQYGVWSYGNHDTIGGTTAAARNIISGNATDGILLNNTAANETVQGNYIGTDLNGANPVPNSNGVELGDNNNTIGGTAPGSTNVISGNSSAGVLIDSLDTGVAVFGDFIGTNAAGTGAVGNGTGVVVNATNVTVGGTASGARDVISGNSIEGILLNTSGDVVLGDYIGTNTAGTGAVGNVHSGIEVESTNETIGGTTAAARNIISGNNWGVGLDTPDSGTVIEGNYIGTNAAGTAAVGNTRYGVWSWGNHDTIGGTTAAARNIISGNATDGILLNNTAASESVQGDYIGTNAAGTAAVANGNGVELGVSGLVIGGTASGARNIISGNTTDGVKIDSGVSGLVQGNFIGLTPSGSGALGNSNGIEIAGSSTTIGGTTFAARNYISGNTHDGLLLDSSGSANLVQGNFVGTVFNGNLAVSNSNGIEFAGNNNTLGGTVTGSFNVISANTNFGVEIDSPASGNVVLGDLIGTDLTGTKALGNAGGVGIFSGGNTLGGTTTASRNIISGSSLYGVFIGASGSTVQGNYIGLNSGGNAALANNVGVFIDGSGAVLGGTTAAARNVISGNGGAGVEIDSFASGASVQGNYIGTDSTGTKAVANNLGVEVIGPGNLVGGSVAGARNVISGNSSGGVLVRTSAGTTVQGNFIGLVAGGNAALGNSGNGVWLVSNNNTVGGTSFYARNYISGNTEDGVLVGTNVSGNLVLGNFIGLDFTGKLAVSNSNGVEIAGAKNTIGGTASGARNVISANSNDGVVIDNGFSANVVLGNFVGLDFTGGKVLANKNGIEIASTANTVGGTTFAARNYISGNTNDGVLLDISASGNQVLGNFLGTDYTGKIALGNSNGVEIAGTNNTVGGTASGAFNVISANSNAGVLLDGTATGNQVQGNYLGTDNSGTKALGNKNGVSILNSGNTVGGTTGAARNIISGNTKDGVLLGASGSTVEGNWIGLTVNGNAALGNSVGVEIAGNGAVLGGTAAAARNVISGNSKDGVLIDSGVSGATVLGNYIGTDSTGAKALANSNGVEVAGAKNIIGGSVVGARNVVSGNSGDGILLDSTASGTTVQGDFIGLNAAGSAALANGANGVEVQSVGNTIGGTSYNPRNYISGNKGAGVKLDSGASGNVVEGNWIGVDYTGKVALGNSVGVSIAGSNNTVGGTVSGAGNTIADNSSGGILVSAGSGNSIHQNAVYANGPSKTGPGITLSAGANNNLAAPSLSSATVNSTTLTVTGTFTAPTANVTYVLEFFANPTGDPEGAIYLGAKTIKPTTTGTISFSFTTTTTVTGTDPVITATLTDASGDTSAFSNGVTS